MGAVHSLAPPWLQVWFKVARFYVGFKLRNFGLYTDSYPRFRVCVYNVGVWAVRIMPHLCAMGVNRCGISHSLLLQNAVMKT